MKICVNDEVRVIGCQDTSNVLHIDEHGMLWIYTVDGRLGATIRIWPAWLVEAV